MTDIDEAESGQEVRDVLVDDGLREYNLSVSYIDKADMFDIFGPLIWCHPNIPNRTCDMTNPKTSCHYYSSLSIRTTSLIRLIFYGLLIFQLA